MHEEWNGTYETMLQIVLDKEEYDDPGAIDPESQKAFLEHFKSAQKKGSSDVKLLLNEILSWLKYIESQNPSGQIQTLIWQVHADQAEFFLQAYGQWDESIEINGDEKYKDIRLTRLKQINIEFPTAEGRITHPTLARLAEDHFDRICYAATCEVVSIAARHFVEALALALEQSGLAGSHWIFPIRNFLGSTDDLDVDFRRSVELSASGQVTRHGL